MSILNTANGKYFKWTGTDLLINAGNFGLDSAGNITANGGTIGGWTINSTNLTSNNGQTSLYNTGYIELRDTQNKPKVTIDFGTTLPDPGEGSDNGNILVPAQPFQTAEIAGGAIVGGNATVPLVGPDGGGNYGIGWSQEVLFTPAFTGFYEFTTWFPKHADLGASGSSGTAIMGLRAYVYDLAGNSLVNDEGREYIEGPVEGAAANAVVGSFPAGTYGNQYPREGTGAYFSNQLLTGGVTVRFLIQWIVFNIRSTDTLTIKAYWPATNVKFVSNVPKININQSGFQAIQDTNRYLAVRPSGWYMYNDPADPAYVGQPAGVLARLNNQGIAQVTGVIGGTMTILNASDREWHSGSQKTYIRSAQFSFANRAAGGHFITSFFFGGYGRAYQIVRAYSFFSPNVATGVGNIDTSLFGYQYNIESVTKIGTNTWRVTFAEQISESGGIFFGGVAYSVFVGSRNITSATQYQVANIQNDSLTGFDLIMATEGGGQLSLMVCM
jgi:hypothetical protein